MFANRRHSVRQNPSRPRWSERLRRWFGARPAARIPPRAPHDPAHLERLAVCACSGYFHSGFVSDPFVFTAEIPLEGERTRGR